MEDQPLPADYAAGMSTLLRAPLVDHLFPWDLFRRRRCPPTPKDVRRRPRQADCTMLMTALASSPSRGETNHICCTGGQSAEPVRELPLEAGRAEISFGPRAARCRRRAQTAPEGKTPVRGCRAT